MTRRVFFSFHYDRDFWRACAVRDAVAPSAVDATGFWAPSMWEEVKRRGDVAIQQLIEDSLSETSVTVVLVGAESAARQLVRYEIQQSYARGNGLLGIFLHNIPDQRGRSDFLGANPFHALQIYFDLHAQPVHAYDWVLDDGKRNIGQWIEAAAPRPGQ